MKDSDLRLAYALARLGLGLNIALHGLIRIPKLPAFAAGMQETFSGSILPPALVYVTAYGIAIAEVIIGILLILGLVLRPALVAGTLLMILLISACCLIENWSAVGIQMVYLAFYCVMIATATFDSRSLDSLRHGKR